MAEHPATKPRDPNEPTVGHVVQWPVLFFTCMALLVLTGLTVYTATNIDLGGFNIWWAMIIATVKATLVCMYFMHLRYDRSFNGIVLIISVAFVMLFLSLAVLDTVSYQSELYPTDSPEYAPLIEEARTR